MGSSWCGLECNSWQLWIRNVNCQNKWLSIDQILHHPLMHNVVWLDEGKPCSHHNVNELAPAFFLCSAVPAAGKTWNIFLVVFVWLNCFCVFSCLWWSPLQVERDYQHSRLAQRVSTQQELCVAGGRTHTVPHLYAVWGLRAGGKWGECACAFMKGKGKCQLQYLLRTNAANIAQ